MLCCGLYILSSTNSVTKNSFSFFSQIIVTFETSLFYFIFMRAMEERKIKVGSESDTKTVPKPGNNSWKPVEKEKLAAQQVMSLT